MNTIQARELRIGNLVKFTEDKELYAGYHNKVNVVDFDTLKDIEFNNSKWYEPIQLNEDWLVKFGFENVDDEIDYSEFVLNYVTIEGNGSDKQEPFHFVRDVDYRERKTEIKYVHQLQNLYWCLCGEELKINL